MTRELFPSSRAASLSRRFLFAYANDKHLSLIYRVRSSQREREGGYSFRAPGERMEMERRHTESPKMLETLKHPSASEAQ